MLSHHLYGLARFGKVSALSPQESCSCFYLDRPPESTRLNHSRQRKIIPIDMDAFYAAVEQRDFPEYRNRPVVVGGAPDSRGVAASCSHEARSFGIHSAMPACQAYRLCPHAVFLRPRFEVYREVSRQIHAILGEFTGRVEPCPWTKRISM